MIENQNVNLYIKIEGQNPSGSVKDRAALYMIEEAEKRGELDKGKTIIEATSGNMGISLSMIGSIKGYKVNIIMSEAMTEERKVIMRSYGAHLILTDRKLGTKGAINKAREMIKNSPTKYWFSNQFNNSDNIGSHYHGISRELLDEVNNIDYLVVGSGTSGTMAGISKRFKYESPKTKIIAVFPPGGYKIQGLQNPKEDFTGVIYDDKSFDKSYEISREEAYKMTRIIAKTEGLFLGMSSGASIAVALNIAKSIKKGNIVIISADRGEKYLSTGLFERI
jgi:cysteine synthase